MPKFHRGTTLPELLVVVAFIAVVTVAISQLSMQSMRIYSRTSEHINPEASLNLALKRMERTIREAMFIRLGSSSTAVEIIIPIKDNAGRIQTASTVINADTQTKALVRREGKHVCYFLGRYSSGSPSLAIPDPANGNTLFMVTTGNNTTMGTDIISSTGVLASSYAQAKEIITGITSAPTVVDPDHPGQALPTTIFAYATNSMDTSASPYGLNAQLLRVTLSMPIVHGPSGGEAIRDHTVSTQFCLRNFETLN